MKGGGNKYVRKQTSQQNSNRTEGNCYSVQEAGSLRHGQLDIQDARLNPYCIIEKKKALILVHVHFLYTWCNKAELTE
jgi:hypothetical protein